MIDATTRRPVDDPPRLAAIEEALSEKLAEASARRAAAAAPRAAARAAGAARRRRQRCRGRSAAVGAAARERTRPGDALFEDADSLFTGARRGRRRLLCGAAARGPPSDRRRGRRAAMPTPPPRRRRARAARARSGRAPRPRRTTSPTRLATDDTERLRLFKTAQNAKIVGFREGLPVRETRGAAKPPPLDRRAPPQDPALRSTSRRRRRRRALDARAAPRARSRARARRDAAAAPLGGGDARGDDAPGAARALGERRTALVDDGFGIDDDGMDDARARRRAHRAERGPAAPVRAAREREEEARARAARAGSFSFLLPDPPCGGGDATASCTHRACGIAAQRPRGDCYAPRLVGGGLYTPAGGRNVPPGAGASSIHERPNDCTECARATGHFRQVLKSTQIRYLLD